MNKEAFLSELEDILQREDKCLENDVLDSYDEWDSLSKMSVMVYFNKKFGIKMELNDLNNFVKVSDLIAYAGDKILC